MSDKSLRNVKIIALGITIVVLFLAGRAFYEHRYFKGSVVLGPGVTEVKTLGDYFPPLKGSINDCNIYILDSGNPGGTVMVIGGTHPEEPGAVLTAQILVENAQVEKGKLIVAIWSNKSASTVSRPGDAYPQFYHIPTEWGIKKFRMGDRWANPLDSWPDPEVYVHYPSKQMLAYMDIRNLNRTWPGKINGSLVERTCFAFMELIKKEKVGLFIDLHEAELEYPVISTIVAHQKAQEIAAMASMILTAMEFERPIGMEFSPPALHGLSHREVGDNSEALSLLFEAPEPFLDRVRGITDENLLLTGKDPFVMKAGEYGLLYEKIDEQGWTIEVRVGRHCSTILQVLQNYSEIYPDKDIIVSNIPHYAEVIKNGVGYYFHNPEEASTDRVVFE
ncbi:MAG: succinylglutamate desuccinylase/aspartoacylase family protein [Candidatus Caldatribacteriota bacterium]